MTGAATRKLKIAVWHNLPSGGGKRALWHHVAGLVKRGHDVEAWCPPTVDPGYLPLSQLCREHVLPLALPPYKKLLPILGVPADYRRTRQRIQAMRGHCRECAAQIGAGGFDVVLGNSCTQFTAPPIARYLEIPTAIYLGEPSRQLFEAMPEPVWAAPAPENESQPAVGLFSLLRDTVKLKDLRVQMREEIDNAKCFDRILVNSFFSRESVLRAYGLDAEVCYLGIDTTLFHPASAPVENYVIGLGAVHFHKGVDRAIRAMAEIPLPQRPKLLWVGNKSSEESTRTFSTLARDLGVAFEIKIMVPDSELVSLLGRAAAMLYTSRLEPFGLAPLEANACGTPVVAIAEGGVRETIVHGENGLLVPDAKPAVIAATLREILDHPARAAELRSRCRNVVLSRWGMDAAIERLETALCEVIKTGKKRDAHCGS